MNRDRSRHGMTLIELLVVIGLISVLAALSAMMLPALRQKDNAGKAATALVANLSIAKQQALRDQAPRGIRFIPDYDLDPSGNICRELQYVELPAPIVPRSANPAQATLTLTSGGGVNVVANLTGAVDNNWLTLGVQKDDFLYANVQGRTYVARVLNDPVAGSNNMVVQAVAPGYVFPGQSTPMQLTEGFQVIRRPRALVGEENVQLPPKMVIRLDNSLPLQANGVWNALSDIPGTKERDIIFLPSGEVSGCPEGKIVLWVQQDDDTDIGKMNLVVVYTRTGQIVIQPVAAGADPFAFTKDGQGSGL